MSRFVVLEVQIKKSNLSFARIHRTICGHAKQPKHHTNTTFCHGYFDTYEAKEFAHSLDVEKVYDCTYCSPHNY